MARTSTGRRARPRLESLDDRVVPATLIDLSTAGAIGTANGALFQQYEANPDDFFSFDWFLQIQNRRIEEGYNTFAPPSRGDGNGDVIFAESIMLGEIPLVTIGGVDYRVFMLDVAETTRSPLVSLDELRFFVSTSGTLSGYDTRTDTLAGLTAIWDMDAAGDVYVLLNSALNPEGEFGDAWVYVPDSIFAGATDSTYVYLYSKFGETSRSQGGAESWALKPPPSATLSGHVYLEDDQPGYQGVEQGLADSWIHLAGIDDFGNSVSLWYLTGADGYYEFTGLRPGTYSIYQETEPPYATGLRDGAAAAGSLGGSAENFVYEPGNALTYDRITDISVGPNTVGINYNFAEVADV
jgi:hypothetical protein